MSEELNWTDENQVSLNAAVYDAMWHWDDTPMDTDDAMSLAAILKEKLTENGLRLVCSRALTASQARAEAAEARVGELNKLLNNVQSDLYDAYQEISTLKGTPDGR